ncbi:MAG: hypothetical protein ACTSWY_07100 [Promethearchaeota archaeon]
MVTIGTGTSIVLKTGNNTHVEHIGGTALGGAFFMGLLKILYNDIDFQTAINLAKEGDRFNIDLKVGDIYDLKDKRVEILFREFTAASFGKINDVYDIKKLHKTDLINALINLIGENIGIICVNKAELHNIKNIIFSGGLLKNNDILTSILRVLCLVNQKNPIFLKNSEYQGALGILAR